MIKQFFKIAQVYRNWNTKNGDGSGQANHKQITQLSSYERDSRNEIPVLQWNFHEIKKFTRTQLIFGE